MGLDTGDLMRQRHFFFFSPFFFSFFSPFRRATERSEYHTMSIPYYQTLYIEDVVHLWKSNYFISKTTGQNRFFVIPGWLRARGTGYLDSGSLVGINGLLARAAAERIHRGSRRLGLYERIMALGLLESHDAEAGHDKDPIHIVGNDGAVGGRVLPAENCIEDTPAAIVGGSR